MRKKIAKLMKKEKKYLRNGRGGLNDRSLHNGTIIFNIKTFY